MEIITFKLGNSLYGIDIKRVRGISVYSGIIITKLYRQKEYLLGLSNFRGEVVAIIDLRIMFKIPPAYDENTTILFVKTNEDKIFGVVCDEVIKIVEKQEKEIQNPTDTKEINKKYLTGFFQLSKDKMVSLLNIDKILEVNKL